MIKGHKHIVSLKCYGNPDYNQDPDRYLFPPKTVKIKSYGEAKRAVSDYINEHQLGGGNLGFIEIVDITLGKTIARVSYNTRIWDMDDNEIVVSGSW